MKLRLYEWEAKSISHESSKVDIFSASMNRSANPRQWHASWLLKVTMFLLSLGAPVCLSAQSISGTVQDPSGALIDGAQVEITGGDLAQPLVLSSDKVGKFTSPDLKLGNYSLRVTRDGFEALVKAVNLQGPVQLQLTLTIAVAKVSVSVSGKSLGF